MPNTPLIEGPQRSSLAYSAAVNKCRPDNMEIALDRYNNRRTRWIAGALLSFMALPLMATTSMEDDGLHPEPRHESVGELVTEFIQKSHYSHISVDDELSSRVMDRYIESLDGNRMYLMQSDIDFYETYRYQLDDVVRSKPLDPVFEMFSIYQTRVRERLEFALAELETEPDFTVDEEYQFDRSEEPWARTEAELDEIWRKRVKNDVLRLELADKPWEESQELLRKRYKRYLKRINQVKADDVFETFMNAFAHTLDPHSSYLSPRNSEEYRIQMSLSYFGIGASLQLDEDYVQIVNIIPGGPAAIDGKLKPKDRITGVAQGPEGEMVDVIGWRLDDVVDLIRGPANTEVRLQIIPAGALPGSSEKIIALTRDQVKLGAGSEERRDHGAPRWSRVAHRRHRGAELLPRLSRHEQWRQGLHQHDAGREAPDRRTRGKGHRRPRAGPAGQWRRPSHRSYRAFRPVYRQRAGRAAAQLEWPHQPPRRPRPGGPCGV